MTGLDWVIVAATVCFAVSGYVRGFIVGALSLVGFVVGAIIGTRIAGALLSAGSASPYAPAFGLFGALTAGAVLATGIGGIGARVRRGLHVPLLGVLDGLAGALLSAAVALGVVWVLGVMVLSLPIDASRCRLAVSSCPPSSATPAGSATPACWLAGLLHVITYLRKVFIPLTRLCRDRCGYCTFATVPGELLGALPV